MWQLNHKEGRAPKNWCFQTVVPEKTLESHLDCKEFKPVGPKGNQPWILIGRTDAEASIIWLPDAKSGLIGKDPDAGKYWRQREKRATGWDGWMASLIRWTWTWANSGRWWGTGRPGVLQPMVLQSQTWLSDWTTTTMQCNKEAFHHISHLTGVKIDSIVHWYYENVFSFLNFYLLLLGCAMSLLLHAGFLWLQRAEGGRKGLLSSCSVQSYCGGFSPCWTRPLGTQASVVVMHRLSCPGACGIFLVRGQTGIPCLALNHWTTKKVPWKYIFIHSFSHQKSIEYLVYVTCWILEENKNNSPRFWDYL